MIKPYRGVTPTIADTVFIEDTAVIVGDVVIESESSVWFHSVVRGDVNYHSDRPAHQYPGSLASPRDSQHVSPDYRRRCHGRSPRRAAWLYDSQSRPDRHGCRADGRSRGRRRLSDRGRGIGHRTHQNPASQPGSRFPGSHQASLTGYRGDLAQGIGSKLRPLCPQLYDRVTSASFPDRDPRTP